MNPYRRHLIGLPLQRCGFADIDCAPELIGLTDVLPGGRMGAWLNDDGDLFLDRLRIERLATALSDRLTPAFLDGMERSLVEACDAVQSATEHSRARARAADVDEVRHLIGDLGQSVKRLVPFGILSKFVPDVLYTALAAKRFVGIPPLPSESAGATLTREAFALFTACRAGGFGPDRLLVEWPNVPTNIAECVLDFCGRQVGFGPLRWEAPGYESPRYVFATLQSSFAEHDATELFRRLDASARMRNSASELALSPAHAPLARVIATWREFLERETWYLRRAFYVGLLPLLLRLVPEYLQRDRGMVIDDILFLELDELTALRPDTRLARVRRARYLANSGYLTEHGLSSNRLGAVLEAA